MRLEHQFRVPAPVPEVWTAVTDPERVAPCMPGATLTSVDGDAFTGTVKVKLGPISLTYKGKGEFLTRDEQARRVVIRASGKDAAGGGTASATVTLTLTPDGDTTVGTVETDLSITGKPAQFGRGLITEVGGKILATFATCLSATLTPTPDDVPTPRTPLPTPPNPPGGTGPGDADGVGSGGARPDSARPDSGETATTGGSEPGPGTPAREAVGPDQGGTASAEPGTATPAATESTGTEPNGEQIRGGPAGVAPDTASDKAPAPRPITEPDGEAEPIDLMELAGRSVAKRALPVAALLAVIGAVIAIAARRRR